MTKRPPAAHTTPDRLDYLRLLEFRASLRRFGHWSDNEAQKVGLTDTQCHLLLVVKADPDRNGPTIGAIAACLDIKRHSTVGLIDRAHAAGLVTRHRDPDDRRLVRLTLTPKGDALVTHLARVHHEKLFRILADTEALWDTMAGTEAAPSARTAGPGV